ncbi:MAG: protein arginine kinase [Omnitrophica bacterium RIFCSPHIGHO2_02_FULL_46_11]|nr:MAG: protein arginine kinase [Omnitrophica bacterium RIFCSPHIGHO2_02_FULL_46_11]
MNAQNTINSLLNSTCEWLRGSGPENDIVLSSRIRLARNLTGYHFHERLEAAEQQHIIEEVERAVQGTLLLKDSHFFDYKDLRDLDRRFLLERHLISQEHANEKGEKALVVTKNEVVSIMVLEEDHLRSQAFQSGLNLIEAWRLMNEIDTALETKLPFAFNPTLGYLTACPTNVGTGLRASCMLHLVGLVMTKQINKVLQALSKLNLAVRGFFGEGTQASGNFFQFSNQLTLGQNETEIVESLERVMRQIIEHEKEARNYLLEKRRGKLEDQIWRAVGTLKSARLISSSEALGLLSLTRLGVDLGFIPKLSKANLNALFLFTQPAHLQKLSASDLNTAERDQKRAELLRTRLKDVELA